MKTFVLAGSHRPNSQSQRVAQYVSSVLQSLGQKTVLHDLGSNPLPLWDEGVWSASPEWRTVWGPIKEELRTSDALVLVTPEWGGMATPGVKNFLLLCDAADVGHKPALIVAVSASTGGAYAVAELRMTSGKNNRICFIPEHVIVRNVSSVLNAATAVDPEDVYIRNRLRYGVEFLGSYAVALRQVRSTAPILHPQFRHGM